MSRTRAEPPSHSPCPSLSPPSLSTSSISSSLRALPLCQGEFLRAVKRKHAKSAMIALHRTVDKMWRAAGDKSVDFNFYTKRALLAGVYSSTTLFWLNDHSTGFSETWHFLDRRINDVMRLQKVRSKYEHRLKHLESNASKYLRRLISLI